MAPALPGISRFPMRATGSGSPARAIIPSRLPRASEIESCSNGGRPCASIISKTERAAGSSFGLFMLTSSGLQEVVFYFIEDALFVRLIFHRELIAQLFEQPALLTRELSGDVYIQVHE